MSLNARVIRVAQEVLARIPDEEMDTTTVRIENGFPNRVKLTRPDSELEMIFSASDDGSHMIEVAQQFDEGNRSVEHYKWDSEEEEPDAVYSALGEIVGAAELESAEE